MMNDGFNLRRSMATVFENFVRDDLDFKKYLRESEAFTKIIPAGAFADDLVAAFDRGPVEPGDQLPWPKMHGKFNLRPRELTLWVGYKGHAKSAVLSEVFLALMRQQRRCLVISPEFTAIDILRRKIKQSATADHPTAAYIRAWSAWANKWLWLFDKQSALRPDLVLGVVAYGIRELGVRHVVIDSLMKCGIGTDDWTAQKNFVDRLQHLAHGSDGAHLHLVAHARKGQDDHRPPTLHDVKGTSEIADMCENVVTVHLNKVKALAREQGRADFDDKYDVALTIEAQRNYPCFGAFGLYFAPGLRFVGTPGGQPRPYFEANREGNT
jgi:twinkle protein